jgi:hypothetical protein
MTTLLPVALDQTGVISVVGIAVSGVVGPGAIAWFARRRQDADHGHERRLKRHDDLAALLDDAASQLAPGASYLREAAEGASSSEPELGEWSSRVHSTYERLLLRLAESDPVCQRFDEARKALGELGSTIAECPSAADRAVSNFESARTAFLKASREKLDRSLR